MLLLESRNNPIVKATRALQTAKARHESGLHLIEGDKLVQDAITSGAGAETLLIEQGHPFDVPAGVNAYAVTRSVLESVCDSRTPQGVAAVVRTPDCALPARFDGALTVLLDGVQDPANVGAIIRSADAFGASGVLLSPACADAYAPKALRAAMGSTYHLPVWRGDLSAALKTLVSDGFTPICGHLKGAEALPAHIGRAALVIGSEGSGVSDAVAALCQKVRLSMYGKAESLNASVAAGILLYVVRQSLE